MSCYQTIDKFIADHRDEIDQHIHHKLGGLNVTRIDDDERELWIANDEQLYFWAYDEGVKF